MSSDVAVGKEVLIVRLGTLRLVVGILKLAVEGMLKLVVGKDTVKLGMEIVGLERLMLLKLRVGTDRVGTDKVGELRVRLRLGTVSELSDSDTDGTVKLPRSVNELGILNDVRLVVGRDVSMEVDGRDGDGMLSVEIFVDSIGNPKESVSRDIEDRLKLGRLEGRLVRLSDEMLMLGMDVDSVNDGKLIDVDGMEGEGSDSVVFVSGLGGTVTVVVQLRIASVGNIVIVIVGRHPRVVGRIVTPPPAPWPVATHVPCPT